MGDAPLLSHSSSLRNPETKPARVLEHCREDKPTVGSPFFRAFPSDRIHNVTKDVSIHLLLIVANPVNYSTEFLKVIPAYSGNVLKLLHVILIFHTFYKSSPFHLLRCKQPYSICWRQIMEPVITQYCTSS
jgi:hypothetical protein